MAAMSTWTGPWQEEKSPCSELYVFPTNVAQPLLDLGGINLSRMASARDLPGGFAVGPRQLRAIDVDRHLLRQCLRAAAIEESRPLIVDQLCRAAAVEADDWPARRHRLDRDTSHGFIARTHER